MEEPVRGAQQAQTKGFCGREKGGQCGKETRSPRGRTRGVSLEIQGTGGQGQEARGGKNRSCSLKCSLSDPS